MSEPIGNTEQLPMAWKIEELDYVTSSKLSMDGWVAKGMTITPLYTHPPMRELSDEEIQRIWYEEVTKYQDIEDYDIHVFAKAIIKASRGKE